MVIRILYRINGSSTSVAESMIILAAAIKATSCTSTVRLSHKHRGFVDESAPFSTKGDAVLSEINHDSVIGTSEVHSWVSIMPFTSQVCNSICGQYIPHTLLLRHVFIVVEVAKRGCDEG